MSGRRRYEIAPRPAEAGGGWRLRLYDGDDEAGGGVFPPDFLGDDQAEYADAVREGEEWVAGEAEAAGVLILATGLWFWDESLEMAENLACCVNEEFGLAPEDAERIARAALRRADTEAGR